MLVLRPMACMRLHNLGQVAYVKYEEIKMRQESRPRIPRSFVILCREFPDLWFCSPGC